MAKIRPNALIASISGKTCSHDDNYFATNKQTGRTYAVKRCFNSTTPETEAQKAHRTAFGNKAKLVSAWMKANKPSATNAKGTEAYQLVNKAYKAQHKIGNIFAYVSKIMDAEGNISISISPSDTPTPPSAGGSGGDSL